MKCPACSGDGWTVEHAKGCDSECHKWGCPVQEQCPTCKGTGEVDE